MIQKLHKLNYIYIAAVKQSLTKAQIHAITNYIYFTDIEFNPAKSINTQARTAALMKLILEEYGHLPEFSKEDFIRYHKEHVGG